MKVVKINEQGRRIGESHPRAELTDHEVELLMDLLDERRALIDERQAEGCTPAEITAELKARGLTHGMLAEKFEISRMHVWRIDNGVQRCQTPATVRPYP